MPKKLPKPTLTVSPVLSVVERRKLMFDGWMNDCVAECDKINEWLLLQLPNDRLTDPSNG